MRIADNIEYYLIAIHELSKSKQIVSNGSICEYLKYSLYTIHLKFFNRNEKILKEYVKINKSKKPTTYILTKKGLETVNLMFYFKNYYQNQTFKSF